MLDKHYRTVQTGAPPGLGAIGVNHFGFWVNDIDAMPARARKLGVEIMRDAHDVNGRHYGYGGDEAGAATRADSVFAPSRRQYHAT